MGYRAIGKTFSLDRDPSVAKSYASQVQSRLSPNTDVIFSPGSIPIAYLETQKPKVFFTDATFAGMIGFYDYASNFCKETIKHGNELEQKAISSSELIIYASEWAAKTAIENYSVESSKIKVVPFGANLTTNRNLEEIKYLVKNRSRSPLDLLFIGVDWNRKGGDLALKIATELNDRGVKTNLHVAGLDKIPIDSFPDFLINHGFISKSTEAGRNKLDNLFSKSHFLLVPSVAEAYGLVFCEASSFGLPSISTNVGGITTVINDGVNGKTFSLNSNVGEWCDYILSSFSDEKTYSSLCFSSFGEYENRLNWDVSGQKIVDLINDI